MKTRNPKIALVLGGGGARGLAHIGVIKALQKAEIPIHIISGASIGAIIGGTYALNPDANVLVDKLYEFLHSDGLAGLEQNFNREDSQSKLRGLKRLSHFMRELYIWRIKSSKQWFVPNQVIEQIVATLVETKDFEDCEIPFYALATDIYSGEKIVIKSGPMAQALLASSSIPGIMQPVEYQGRMLSDGGIVSPIPTEIAKENGADIIIAVDVGRGVKKRRRFQNIADIMEQAENIKDSELEKHKLKLADIVIKPKVGHISWAHFSKASECIRRGELATWKEISKIKMLLEKKSKPSFWEKLLPFTKSA